MNLITVAHNNQSVPSDDMMTAVKRDVAGIGPMLLEGKLNQQKVLSESIARGGPASVQGAFATLLDYAKIGMRQLSREVGVPRKKLEGMINGRVTMPPDVINDICKAIERKHPGMLDRLEKLADAD